jgi:O-antigen/teichoic acid export membrane protein
VLPVSVGIAALAGPLVRVLLGAQWGEAVPIIQVLAFSGAITALTSNNVAAYLALGQPHRVTLILLARLLVFVAAAASLVNTRHVLAVAYADLVASLGSLLVSLPILFHALDLKARRYLATLWRPLLASGLMGLGLYLVVQAMPGATAIGAAALSLLICVPVGATVYLGCLWLLWLLSGQPHSVELQIAQATFGAVSDALGRRRVSP